MIFTRGNAAPEVEATYLRARELCRRAGDVFQLLQVLNGLRRFYTCQPELYKARELSLQTIDLAEKVNDERNLARAHFNQAEISFWLGRIAQVQTHAEQAIGLCESTGAGSLLLLYGVDTLCGSRVLAGQAWLLLGAIEQGTESIEDVLLQSRELAHPVNLFVLAFYAAVFYQFKRENGRCYELSQQVIETALEHKSELFCAWGNIMQGSAVSELEEPTRGIDQLKAGMAAAKATGSEAFGAYFNSLLAAAYIKSDQAQKGLEASREALSSAAQTGERMVEAEARRLQGELVLMLNSEDRAAKAQASFKKAIAVAKDQEAVLFELRAATSLARLWQSQGKIAAATKLLQKAYGGFTEGFDAVDLKEARILLEELSLAS